MRSGQWRTTWFLSCGNLDSRASQLLGMIVAVVLPIGWRSITRIEWNVSLYLTFFRPQTPGSGPTRSWLPLSGRGRSLRSPSHFPRGSCQPLLMPLSMTPLAVGDLLQMRLAPKCGQRISKRYAIPLASTRSVRSIARLRPDLEGRHAGRRIACPVLVLWSGRGPLGTWYAEVGGPLALWRAWATNVSRRPLEAGHFFPEEIPEQTAAELSDFLG